MKLTNISLAILVAIGLVACGGSDDKNNQPADNNNAGHQGAGNGNPPPPPPPPKKEVEDPNNAASGLEVEERYETNTTVAKTIYANRRGLSTLAGYKGANYEAGSVSTPDILRGVSAVNYLSEGWVADDGTIRVNPLQTYAKGASGAFYRVVGVYDKDSNLIGWDKATPASFFGVLGSDPNPNPTQVPAGEFSDIRKIPASNIFFVPNPKLAVKGSENNQGVGIFKTATNYGFAPALGGNVAVSGTGSLGIDDSFFNLNNYSKNAVSKSSDYDLSRTQVTPSSVTVGENTYTFDTSTSSSNSFKLDLGLDRKTDIQMVPVKLNYSIYDGKGTSSVNDDSTAFRSTDAGELRVYNVNYSLALLEVNEAAVKDSNSTDAAPRNGLGFDGDVVNGYIKDFGKVSGSGKNGSYGPFQVRGFQTQALPLNGRATYRGQSFGVNSKGKLDLSVDFGEERAAIGGSITERTTMDGKKSLDSMQLKNIYLSQPSQYSVTGSVGIDSNNTKAFNGLVDLGGQQNWGTWAVQLYGPNAENAAGVIAMNNSGTNQTQIDTLENVVEVFNSVRTDINPKSLNNQKNP